MRDRLVGKNWVKVSHPVNIGVLSSAYETGRDTLVNLSRAQVGRFLTSNKVMHARRLCRDE